MLRRAPARARLDEARGAGVGSARQRLAPAHRVRSARSASSARTSANGARWRREDGEAGARRSRPRSSAARNGSTAGSIAASGRRRRRRAAGRARRARGRPPRRSSSAPRSPDEHDLAGRVVVGDGDAGGLRDRLARPRACRRSSASIEPASSRPRPSACRAARRAARASSSGSTPAAASAASSPSEWPAAHLGLGVAQLVQPASSAQKIAGWAKRVDSSTRGKGSSPTSSMQRSNRSGHLPRDVVAHLGGLGALAGEQQGDVGSRGHGLHPGACAASLPAMPHLHPPGRGVCATRWGVTGFAAMPGLRSVTATRYVTPLREGGSLPGARRGRRRRALRRSSSAAPGRGRKALVAEVVARRARARRSGCAVPELVRRRARPGARPRRARPEIQDLLLASAGLNLGLDFLPGALPFRPPAGPAPDARARGGRRLARRARHQRRPHARSNPNLLALARPALADRPRRRALLPPRHRRSGRATRGGRSPPIARPRAAAVRRARSPRPTSASRRGHARARSSAVASARCRPRGSTATTATYVDYLRDAARAAARLRRRPSMPVRVSPFAVRDRARRAAGRARRAHQRRRHRSSAAPQQLPRRAHRARRGAAARALAPEPRPRRPCARTSRRSSAIAAGDEAAGPIARLDRPQRFHWLVAPSSTIIQPSQVHTGLCEDPEDTLARLLDKLVT